MLHAALLKLIRLQGRGTLRRMVRGIKTPGGAIFFAVGLLMFLMWLGPGFVGALLAPRSEPATVRHSAPIAIMVFCLLSLRGSSSGAGVYFTPSEVDFLFAGPFNRRELLVYKLVKTTISSAIVALFFSVGLLKFVTWWIAGYVGCFLTFMFITLFSMAVALLAQTVNERAFTRLRRTVLLAILILLALTLGRYFGAGALSGFASLAERLQESWIGRCLLAPFDVFGRTLTAETLFPGLVAWASVALAINLALCVVVLRLDVNYLEAAVATSQKIYDKIQRMRRGQRMTWANRSAVRLRLPQFPRWAGVGPIAWRQLTTAVRHSPGFLLTLLIITVSVGLGVHIGGLQENLVPTAIGVVIWMTFFFTTMLRYDFRGDLDNMEWLKLLPLRPTSIALGELVAPVIFMSMIQLILLAGLATLSGAARTYVGIAALFVLPLNFFLFGVENLFFLLVPTRMMTPTPGDFQSFGRQMVAMIAKMLLLFLCLAAAAGPGFIAYWLSGWHWPAFLIASWLATVLEASAVVPLVAWAFRRFDVSADMPA